MNGTLGQVLKVVLIISIALAAFTTGLGAPAPKERSLWRQPSQLSRALLAVLVVVPAWAFVFLEILPLPQVARSGIFLAVLSVGIGPFAGMKRFQGDSPVVRRAFELNVTMLLASVVYVPLMVALLAVAFRLDVSLSVGTVARIVFLRALIPLLLGLLVARMYPQTAARIRVPLARAVNITVGLISVVIVFATRKDLAAIGVGAWLAALGVAIGATLIGHALGGPTDETRAPLAGAAAMRFPALGLLLASIAPLGNRLVPAVMAYMLMAIVVLGVYGRVSQRAGHGSGTARPTRPAPRAPAPTAA
jgi:BASS family bile acid:Na+ symporter